MVKRFTGNIAPTPKRRPQPYQSREFLSGSQNYERPSDFLINPLDVAFRVFATSVLVIIIFYMVVLKSVTIDQT